MGLDKILSVSGRPGLYKVQAQTRSGFLAESLLDGKRISVGIQHNVSILSEIAIYTLTEELPLREVLKKIKEKENGKPTSVGHKDGKDKLEEYFFEVLPDYDEDRVYASDIKKIVQWYNLLQKHDLLDVIEESSSDEEE
jgi:ABC-type glycerol-3-phosphate transport system substrate-binding protein